MPNGRRISLHLDSRLRLITLGGAALVSVEHDGTPTEVFGPGKPLALLAYLTFSPRRTATREHLIDLLWGDTDPERASHALRQTIWQIRQTLGERALVTHNGDLKLAIAFEADRDQFLAAIEAGALEEAVERYAGEFLPELAVPGGAVFEQWADLERVRLRAAFLRAAEALTRRHLTSGRVREAQRLARRARDADPLNESGWRLFLEALIAGNDYVAATMEADALGHLLRAEEREPEPATRVAIRLARQAPPEPVMSNQPSLVAELVGREKEFANVVAAWDAARRGPARHVHLTAPPGLGKTRLLQDVLARLRAGGARAVYIRANPGERHISFAFAGDVAAAIARLPGATGVTPTIAATLVALNPALSAVYSAAPERRRGEDALRSRGIATAELLIAIAEEAPLCVLLDDLHWADQESRQVLSAALARVGPARLLVVTAARPAAEMASQPDDTMRLKLDPLSTGQTEALVGSLARLPGEPWARSLAERLHLSAGGSPLLILESLQLALEAGTLRVEENTWRCAEPLALAAQLAAGAALRHRIEQLDRTSQWLLVAMAVAGTPVSTASLATLVGRSEDAVLPVLTGLEERGLAMRTGTDWEPAHDEIATLALETAGPEAIRAAQAGLGQALAVRKASEPGVALQAARHLAACAEERPLQELAEWWVRQRHGDHDRRAPQELVAELVGQDRTSPLVKRLTQRLPLHVRLGLDSGRRVAVAGLATLALAGGAGVALSRPAHRPLDAVLLVGVKSADTAQVLRIDLRQGDWQEHDRFDIERLGVPFPALEAADLATATPSPDGRVWAASREFADSGDVDLVLIGSDGTRRRVTATRGDDGGPDFSPDGRQVVFTTGRWSPLGHYALAVMDIASGGTRRLTSGEVSDASPRWSPDGTRIAFVRSYFDRREPELCWVAVDGDTPSCFRPAGVTVVSVAGWVDATRLIISGQQGNQTLLAAIDPDVNVVNTLAMDVAQARVSPGGRWIACLCKTSGDRKAWSLFPTDRPADAKPLFHKGSPAGEVEVVWSPTGASRQYLNSVRIGVPAFVPAGVSARLRLTGLDVAGNAVPVRDVHWRSTDTARAIIDSDLLLPRRTGQVTVIGSAGGWRKDSVRVSIVQSSDSLLLHEDWGAGLDRQFIPYGSPRPDLLAIGPKELAFWNKGDGSFNSGAYSRRRFASARGLGVEARVSAPVTALQWQYIDLTLNASLDSAGLVKWNHVSGSVPGSSTPTHCGAGFPAGEGAGNRQLIVVNTLGTGAKLLAPRLGNGNWHTLRVQIFPDGRCGTALDGRPLAIVDGALPSDARYWLNISGKSVGTKVLVGPVEVWEGVRGGVDWSTAPR